MNLPEYLSLILLYVRAIKQNMNQHWLWHVVNYIISYNPTKNDDMSRIVVDTRDVRDCQIEDHGTWAKKVFLTNEVEKTPNHWDENADIG